MHGTPRIVLTAGEPAGIGPDLIVSLAQSPLKAELLTVCDPRLLQERAARLGLNVELQPFEPERSASASPVGVIKIVPNPLVEQTQCGTLNKRNSEFVLSCLRAATGLCMDGVANGLVTGPVHKGIINEAGIQFTGHTELLAQLTNVEQPVMLLVANDLRVALATTHLPLQAVPKAITSTLLERVIRILNDGLRRWYKLSKPRILICGLNPHAGEGGYLGREEVDVIAPTVARLQSQGYDLQGPVPADTAFVATRLQEVDAVLAMYHDQGLPVLKHHGFGKAVNITLGLPFIRTSVDHGTALELAGSGTADVGSLRAAVDTALRMANEG